MATGHALVGAAAPALAGTPASKEALSVKDASVVPAAVGNGSADDTTAIQVHLNAASSGTGANTVYFPPGTYKVTGTINVPAGVNIVGGGNAMIGTYGEAGSGVPGTATLFAAFAGTVLRTAADVKGSIISNLRVAGSSPSTGVPSVEIRGGSNGVGTRVECCAFWRRGPEVVRWSASGAFVNNYINGHYVAGCVGLFVFSPDSKFLGNDITSEGECVVVDTGAGGTVFEENIVYNSSSSSGIWWKGSRGIIAGNRADENGGAGILIEGWGNVVTGNCLVLNGVVGTKPAHERVGVRIQYGWGNAVTGNTFSNWTHGAISNTQQYGVSFTGPNAKNNSVTGNTFTSHPVGAIYTAGGGTGNVTAGNATHP